ncbi:hypothetical protein [Desulfovibrio ferrophilus]|uniref:Uncharacterized protein related to multiheme cytochrome n=1 Tax=Desulfovibrio ferrophilus TaxID=241368 RepID=A0A2Z6AZC6_9BACT|nr:hypothetical protein [Desulfovibrio ferrophilus]BBD08617.1 uncharacterized protein related to multiheme cytochrome [Desulfovibrio ferrophilus]
MHPVKTILGLLLFSLWALPGPSWCMEVKSDVHRYRNYELSTGYYERYEVRPGLNRPLIMDETPARPGILSYGPGTATVRVRTRLQDAHAGIAFYEGRTCVDCHRQQGGDNLHVVRNDLVCRQCHGGEPISSVNHYYSPLNKIRRHAYICAKCHQGAGISYASYLVHEPNPAMMSTRESFPLLFYAFWAMIALAGGTLAIFLPHTVLWGLRELFSGGKKKGGDES